MFVLAPFAAGLMEVAFPGGGGHGPVVWDQAALIRATAVSIGSASLATLLAALGGVPLGYMLARMRPGPARWLGMIVQLPLALPPLASGVLLLFLLGPYSPLGRLLAGWVGQITDSFMGIVLAETFVAAPFAVIAARSGFEAVPPLLEDVAATLGHGAAGRLYRVALPTAWPAIRSGLLLAWLRGFGEFGATVMVAYHPYSLPVYTYVSFGARGLPAMLPVLLPTLLTAVSVLILADLRSRSRTTPATIPPLPPAASPPPDRPFAFHVRRRLPGFDLDVAWAPRARRLAILGPSGSGKSMILRLIAGLEPGEVPVLRIDGADIAALPAERRRIAYVPQSPALLPRMRVGRQLCFARGAANAAATVWLDRLGLAGLAQRYPDELSLGQQQRVAIGRALHRPARLVLLDEPFSALDTGLRREMQAMLRALQAEIACITILVTHDPDEAALLADEILYVDAGRGRVGTTCD